MDDSLKRLESFREKSPTKEIWWTKDIAIASFMKVALGDDQFLGSTDIDEGDIRNRSLKFFVFSDKKENGRSWCETLKEDYISARPTTKVVARHLMDCFRALRSLSYR